MPIGSNLSVTLPTAEDTFVDIVAKLSAAIELLAEVLEAPIDSGSLDITTALTLNGAPIINVGGLRLVGGLSTQPGTMYIDSSGELHVVTTVGDIQITSNGDLNVAALGTIGGDYGGGNPATVTFDDTSGEYRFQEDTNDWATIVAETFIAKVNGGAGSISFGALSSITTARDFKIKSLPASGVSGLAYEASSGGVVDANQTRETLTHKFTSVDLTGDVLVSSRSMFIGPSDMQPRNDSGGSTMGSTHTWIHNVSGASGIYAPVRLPPGAIIEGISYYAYKGSATGTISAALRSSSPSADSLIASVGSNSANNPGNITITNAAINHPVAADVFYYVLISTSGQANDETIGIKITYSGKAI